MAAIAGGVSAGFNFLGQKDQAEAMEKYNKQMAENKTVALSYKNRGVLTQLRQAEDAYATDKLNTKLKAVQKQGRAMAASADSGGGGRSVGQIMTALENDETRTLNNIQDSLENTRATAAETIEGNQYSTESSIKSNWRDTSVNVFDSILAGAKTGLSIYGMAGGSFGNPSGNPSGGTGNNLQIGGTQ
ncbi:hypothetical protein BZG05_13025 [Salinivibrio kushneri]|uniref:virion core protein, T7 gp14 family n=1 Tax=Salinivibrio kushneri TaxID=1908198 RepID=UPI000988A6F7|nr:hypothetical protein [Salinivibrio kushneri]OOE32880.1 hypothetical protein BZG05_13025 [Salinivibrio kushneri]